MFRTVRLILLGLFVLSLPLRAAVFTVTKTADTLDGACDHDCSLREAVTAANARTGRDAVVVPAGLYTLTREGRDDSSAQGDLDVLDHLAILGAGAKTTVLDGGGLDRVLHGLSDARLEVHDVTIRNGRVTGTQRFDGDGGGILGIYVTLVGCHVTGNRASRDGGGVYASELTASATTFSDNEAAFGGALANFGVMRLSNVTVSGNRATEAGGGLFVAPFDQVLTQVTITGNQAPSMGGVWLTPPETCPSGVGFCSPMDFSISRSIVAGNISTSPGPGHPDCPFFTDPGANRFNVFGVNNEDCFPGPTDLAGTPAAPLDPRLTPLGDYGGPVPTHLPLPDSPAVDLIPSALCTATDQRGRPRPADGDGDGTSACDAGAIERGAGCEPDADTLCLSAGNRFRVTVRWTAQGNGGTGKAVPLALDTGAFWFFNPDNLELTIKVLDGCNLNGRFWVFLSGLTDVGVEVTVEDTATGETWTHTQTAGTALQPRLDTNALEVCP